VRLIFYMDAAFVDWGARYFGSPGFRAPIHGKYPVITVGVPMAPISFRIFKDASYFSLAPFKSPSLSKTAPSPADSLVLILILPDHGRHFFVFLACACAYNTASRPINW
jgi:hypothetical protein